MQLEQYLQNIGLNDKEAKIYLAGLQLGPATIQELARASGIKRTTIYEVIEALKEKSLINVTQKNKRKIFIVQEPDNLQLFLKQKENILSQILPDLEALKNTAAKKPAIRIFDGIDGLKQIYDDMIKKPGEISVLAAPRKFIAQTLLDYLRQDWEIRRIKNQISLKRININNTGDPNLTGKKISKPEEQEEIYYLPEENYPFSVGLYIYRQKVAFVSYGEQEMFGIIIRSPEINKTFRLMFSFFWGK